MFMERPRSLILWGYYCLHFNSLGAIKKAKTFQSNLRYIHRENKNKKVCARAFLYTQQPFERPGHTYNAYVLCPGSKVSLLCRTTFHVVLFPTSVVRPQVSTILYSHPWSPLC